MLCRKEEEAEEKEGGIFLISHIEHNLLLASELVYFSHRLHTHMPLLCPFGLHTSPPYTPRLPLPLTVSLSLPLPR